MKIPKNNGSLIKQSLEIISLLAAIVGIPIALSQFLIHNKQQRIVASMQLVQYFQSDQMATHRSALLGPWLRYSSDLSDLISRGPVEAKLLDDWATAIVNASVEAKEADAGKPDLRLSLYFFIDFFDQVQVCRNSGLCDDAVLRAYFDDFALSFGCLYRAPIRRLREDHGLTGMGHGVAALVARKGDCR